VKEDIQKRSLRAGMRGTVVHQHTPDEYEVEFSDSEGETIDMLALSMDQFIVVWRAGK
jgi:hypothetical protein